MDEPIELIDSLTHGLGQTKNREEWQFLPANSSDRKLENLQIIVNRFPYKMRTNPQLMKF
jgi:hypothetical protein